MTKITSITFVMLCLALSSCGKKGPLAVDPPVDATLSEQAQGQRSLEGDSEGGLNSLNRQIQGSTTIIPR